MMTLFATYKLSYNAYALICATGGFSITSSIFWFLVVLGQLNYLSTVYLKSLFMVEQIELMKNLEEVRIKTISF